jgi:NAD(P)-dependent dehydrogenase (short-subunit alcohol dehydrogenase family)
MDLGLEGRRAIVTGASRGIGLAVAHALAQEGVDLVVAARGREALDAAAADVAAATGRRAMPVAVDTTSEASVRAMVAAATEALGGVDILVNAAAQPGGGAPPPPISALADDELRAEIETKVLGYLRCIRAVAPLMIEQRWGRIVNVGGLAARQAGSTVGSIRNVAVAAMTKNAADELGRHGIGVTVVHPGPTRTERTGPMVAERAAEQGVPEQDVEHRMAAGTTIGRLVEAHEIAWVVAFLVSPRSVAITGDAIAVGGGARGAIHY